MSDPHLLGQELEGYIRPDTFPLAVRILKEGEALPPKVKRPYADMNLKISLCQAVGLARRYGWTIAVDKEDQSCPIAQVAFGFAEALPFYTEGHLACGMYTETLEAGARSEAAIPKLPPAEAGTVIVGPLSRANYQPEVVVIYGNSAQVMRLVAGALYQTGGSLPSKASPRADCADIIIGTMQEDRAQVILPCYGDRLFGQTQDHEMCFTLPFQKLPELLEGLKGTHKGGVRYPIPTFLRYEAEFPATYQKLASLWADKSE